MMQKMVSKSEFKPRVFKYLRYVAEQGRELIISEYGKPVVKIIPYVSESEGEALRQLRGLVKTYKDPLSPVAQEDWESLK